MLVLLTVLLLTLRRRSAAPSRWRKKSTKSSYSNRFSSKTRPELKIASRRFLKQWPSRRLRLQVLNKLLGASWLALPLWKQVQPLALAAPTRQDLGTYSDIVTAPQPLDSSGPMAQGHLTIAETLSQAPKTNMHEVPSYCSFRVNNTTLGLPMGSITFGKSPTYQPLTNPPKFIAKQVAYPPDSYSRRELNARTLWPDTRMMVSPTKLIVHFATAEPISQSASPSHLKTEKSENNLRLCGKFLAQKLKVLFPKEMTKFSVFQKKDRRNGVGKPVFKLAPFGNGQLFDLTAPHLRVPGIPDDVLQQVISQASHLAQKRTANV